MNNSWRRIRVTFAALLIGVFALATASAAELFPSRTIRLVVPNAAGGSTDVLARVIGQKLSENIGQPVVVENRPGAGGIIAAEAVMKAPADGYTLLIADTGTVAINPSVYPKLPYDPVKDFAPVTQAVAAPLVLVVNAALPVQSVKQFIDYAKANPGLSYGSSGNGSFHHLSMELLKSLAGVSMTHIPYKGTAQSIPALLSGEVAAVFAAIPAVVAHAKSGKIRLLAVGTAKRVSLMPDLPTIAESGVPDYDLEADVGFLAPAGTPRDVVAKLNAEIVKVLQTPEVAQRLATLGLEVIGAGPDKYAASIQSNIQKYRKIVKDSGTRLE